ncbi:unnamed protein product [Dicrocoelium dendriticum]|nr:unnamed protein product [Dicrocoelium dendriticum]
MVTPENKLRQMQEEMNRFEAEIASQIAAPVPAAPTVATVAAPATPLTGGFAFPSATAFIPHSVQTNLQATAALPMPPGLPMYVPLVQHTIPTFQPTMAPIPPGPLPVQHKTVVTNITLPTISNTSTISKSSPSEIVQKVITAPPQMAGPDELAARAKEAAAVAAKRQKSVSDDDDDDVTRALLAAAAGVTYTRVQCPNGKDDFRIFCGDLGNEVSDDTLARAFNQYASFTKARVVRDKRTGKSRGYGFVSFSDPADFTRAMREMNGKYVGNRPIKLKRSDWQSRQLETHRKKEKERKKLGLKN